ncbi:MAG: hypothetical protein P1U85_00155 [Verrucomicrobiales bacterium]|nr:hypothetical protein [Verrucomicrobiales bacterium]
MARTVARTTIAPRDRRIVNWTRDTNSTRILRGSENSPRGTDTEKVLSFLQSRDDRPVVGSLIENQWIGESGGTIPLKDDGGGRFLVPGQRDGTVVRNALFQPNAVRKVDLI